MRPRYLHPGKGISRRMDPAALVRFLKNVTVTDNCWLWTGATDKNGYGQFWFAGRARWAHRLAYVTFRSPIRNGNDVDHRCHRRGCVNPDHLRQLSRHSNSLDGARYAAARREPAPF